MTDFPGCPGTFCTIGKELPAFHKKVTNYLELGIYNFRDPGEDGSSIHLHLLPFPVRGTGEDLSETDLLWSHRQSVLTAPPKVDYGPRKTRN
jgi:hypothetical protein